MSAELLDFITRPTPERDPRVLEGLRRQMVLDFVLCVEAKLDRSARFASNGLLAPVMYEITGSDHDRDKLFLGEVLDAGPGVTVGGKHEEVCVARGDIFLCILHNLSYRLLERGRKVYQVRNGVVYGKLDPETFHVKPLQDLILVRRSGKSVLSSPIGPLTIEERIQRHQSGGEIWLPEEAISTDDVRSPAILLEYGEVIDQGPGRYREGNWSTPPTRRGDLVLYDASYSTLPVTIKGESYVLVPTPQLAQIADRPN